MRCSLLIHSRRPVAFILSAGSLLLALTMSACSTDGSSPKPKIDETRFVNYYASYLTLSHELKLEGFDSAGIAHGIDTLRRSYRLDQADIQAMIDYYHQHLDDWRKFNSRVLARLADVQKKKGKS